MHHTVTALLMFGTTQATLVRTLRLRRVGVRNGGLAARHTNEAARTVLVVDTPPCMRTQ